MLLSLLQELGQFWGSHANHGASAIVHGLQRQAGQPGALLRRLAQQDPVVDHWLAMHPRRQETDLQLLLP